MIRIFTSVVNRSDFLELQSMLFKQFLKNEYTFHVVDDSVDDRLTRVDGLGAIMASKISRDPKLTVSLKSDQKAKMDLIMDIHTQLRKANALKLSYAAMTKAD